VGLPRRYVCVGRYEMEATNGDDAVIRIVRDGTLYRSPSPLRAIVRQSYGEVLKLLRKATKSLRQFLDLIVFDTLQLMWRLELVHSIAFARLKV